MGATTAAGTRVPAAVSLHAIGADGDRDGLLAIGGKKRPVLDNLGEVDDPEPDLRLDDLGAGSQSVTDGEPAKFRRA